ncbi:MAG: excinuclease ABC subunit UvrA [Thermodesulfobacterium sp.]|jgi:excinuclease ABC subunit A|nr:excinuclease ABC subunit UvrA [Thermodesulfobacterium sp.]
MKFIQVLSARQNNLKGFDLFLPFYHLTVVTGVSGAGKSSLVFDILYAEGQRRYLETFSSYVRQFLERLPRPRVKEILNIPPALAFPQGNFIRTSRSTVGTLTEVSNFVKMLFYQSGKPFCPICQREVLPSNPSLIAEDILKSLPGQRVLVLAPLRKETSAEYLKQGLLAEGFSRVFISGRVCELEEVERLPEEFEVVLHRLIIREETKSELISSLELAFKLSDKVKIRTVYGEEKAYTLKEECPTCGYIFPKKTPALFSFNTAQGACPECKGFGSLLIVDLEALVKEPQKSLAKGAIPILDYPAMTEVKLDLFSYLREKGIPVDIPFSQYPEEVKRLIFEGEGKWYGFKEVVDWLYAHRYKPHFRILLAKLRREVPCPTCKGTRFNPQALLFRIKGLSIADFYRLEVKDLVSFLESFIQEGLPYAEERLAREVLRRVKYLQEVGLDYLTLGRASKTLSGGEVSRCLLTRALSSDLAETLYLIDEPTTGLHPLDTSRVLGFMKRLVQRSNTVVVVEHDPEVVLSADFLVELGPGGGEGGGYLLHAGEPKKILELETPTGVALRELAENRDLPPKKLDTSIDGSRYLIFKECRAQNLKGFDLEVPLSGITVIVGVSGSGKSTLLEEVVAKTLLEVKEGGRPSNCKEVEGIDELGPLWNVHFLTQESLARSPRAIVATYIDIYPYIRRLLASTDAAKSLGLTEGHFSFNSPSAQCPNCRGLGYEVVELQFLSDLVIPCEVCQGKRFREEILEVRWRGKNIAEILELTVESALEFFGGHREIRRALEVLDRLGLSYLKLGQPLSTLSGGEAQRLRLAELLIKVKFGKDFILLDEPTVGLHLQDVKHLIQTLELLKEEGHTIIIVEHHPEVMLCADHIVELGPEGGEKGGYLLYQGSLKGLLKAKTPTSKALKEYLSTRSFTTLKEAKPVLPEKSQEEKVISLRGVKHHNLKNLDLDLPREKLIIITGVSGSGKSTLAFDVIFSEGQRRFLETLPGYFRQFIKVHEEPNVDLITGLPPTVALEQRSGELSPRSTVGTLTEILPYLRLLYSRVSKAFCPSCGKPIKPRTEEELLSLAESLYPKHSGKEIKVLANLVRHRKGHFRPLFERYLKRGYHSFRVDGEYIEIPPIRELSRYKEHTIELNLGSPRNKEHFLSLVELALREGKGEATLDLGESELYLSTKRTCLNCRVSLPEPSPLLFAFNTKVGACPTCEGLGRLEEEVCPACQGSRLRDEVRAFKINGLSLPELCDLSIDKALDFIENLKFEGREKKIAEELVTEVRSRLRCLIDLGLSYLTLSRSADTLSSGEGKRVRISAEVGSNLTGVAYILDEPTIGLHPRDTAKLIEKLKELCRKGNTLIVVEHDEETILAGDFIVDLGPGGGRKGGEILFAGSKEDFLKSNSLTAKALKDLSRKQIFSLRRAPKKFLRLKKAKLRNLKGFDVEIPLASLVALVGVSGSGKSTLICEALYQSLQNLLSKKKGLFGLEDIEGWEELSSVYLVDHSPIGNTPRSIPATYINVFTDIRRVFANTLLAKQLGYDEGRFSFNNEEGQCPHCRGHGVIKVEIPFLPTLYQTCEYCQGKRYNQETLRIKLKEKSIADVLEMDFATALEFYENYSAIKRKLELVCQIGLDYLLLGQPSPTLSGGEAQRIKLAKELGKSHSKPVLYILDEPTTGLHILDVEKLASVLQGLVSKGHTVVFIEHNPELIKHADWVIELGPEGGDKGGELLFSGPIDEFLEQETETAKVLREYVEI